MNWLFGPKERESIHIGIDPERLSAIAGSLRDLALRAIAGSAELVVSPGAQKTTDYLQQLYDIKAFIEENQTKPRRINAATEDLRKIQEEFGDWQRNQTQQLIEDFLDSVGQVIFLCEASLNSSQNTSNTLEKMNERLKIARDSEDIGVIRRILREEVEAASQFINEQHEAISKANENIARLVQDLENRVRMAEESAQTDHLTNLGNRAAYDFFIQAALLKVRSGEGPYSIVLFDLNGFKALNDQHGHLAGDAALNAFAGRIRRAFPKPALVCRLGGDEFVVVANVDEKFMRKKAARVAEDLNHNPLALTVADQKLQVKLGVSYGVSQIMDEDNAESLFQRADKAMYAQKHSRAA